MAILNIFLAILPVILIILYIYHKDKYDKEPLRLIIICFILGIISVIPAIILETFAMKLGLGISDNVLNTALFAIFGVGLSEEFSKYIFVRYYAYKKKDFNEPFDGIIYAVVVSMGFAAAENIKYVMDGGTNVALLRMFTAVPAHAAFAVVMGYYIGLAKFSDKPFPLMVKGLALATLFHGLYDLFLFLNEAWGLAILSFVVLYFGIRFSFRTITKSQSISPFRRWTFKKHNE